MDAGQDRVEQRKLSAEMLLQDAQEALQDGDPEGALDLLRLAAELDPERIELQGYQDLARSQLLKRYRDRLGDLQRVPRVVTDPDRLARYNLPSGAGFLLSLVDGATSFDQIVTLSGMDAFEAFRILNGLLDAKIVAVEP